MPYLIQSHDLSYAAHPHLGLNMQAVGQQRFSIAYANLCKVMSPIKVEWVAEDGNIRSNNFRRMLLTKCQKEFQKDKKDDESVKSMLADIKTTETVRGKEGGGG